MFYIIILAFHKILRRECCDRYWFELCTACSCHLLVLFIVVMLDALVMIIMMIEALITACSQQASITEKTTKKNVWHSNVETKENHTGCWKERRGGVCSSTTTVCSVLMWKACVCMCQQSEVMIQPLCCKNAAHHNHVWW